MSPGHLLHGVPVSIFAHREGTDDILCRRLDNPSRVTVIHLTGLGREEIDTQYPAVEADGDVASFLGYEGRFAGR